MRVIAIKTPGTPFERNAIDEMHQLRARIFRGRLAWNVSCVSGREYDEFDRLKPTYILALTSQDRVAGCARLLPATGTTMLSSVFQQLLHEGHLPTHERMVESSRFCVDTEVAAARGQGALHSATLSMFAGIVEWSVGQGYTEIATATDVRFERILTRAGWPMTRLGNVVMINETRSVAGLLRADRASFERLRPDDYQSSFATFEQKAA
jgi:N-acyl-L-homoserine lactone synthetase